MPYLPGFSVCIPGTDSCREKLPAVHRLSPTVRNDTTIGSYLKISGTFLAPPHFDFQTLQLAPDVLTSRQIEALARYR